MATRRKAMAVPDDGIDTSGLEAFVGYNIRRASLAITDHFLNEMAVHALRPVEFTILLLIKHNAGITSAQLCSLLNIQSSNLVGLVKDLERRGLSVRQPHPLDGRALGLHLTPAGSRLIREAQRAARQADALATARLTDVQRSTLVDLLQLVYR